MAVTRQSPVALRRLTIASHDIVIRHVQEGLSDILSHQSPRNTNLSIRSDAIPFAAGLEAGTCKSYNFSALIRDCLLVDLDQPRIFASEFWSKSLDEAASVNVDAAL